MPILRVENLCKEFKVYSHKRGLLGALRNLLSASYEKVLAVDDVSFEVEEGQFLGYVGPNGAGKSTTIKMLTGILVPTSGRCEVAGRVPHKHRKVNALKIGVVFGQRTQLWWDLPPIETFHLLGHIYRVGPARIKENIDFFTELLQLSEFLDTPVRKLSLGQKMRCELTASLLHDPEILFLDEPTIGLDAVAKEAVRKFLGHINRERGTTILLTTHDLNEIEQLCRRVMVIDRGKIIHDGTIESLKGIFGNYRQLIVDFQDEALLTLPDGARELRREGKRCWIEFNADTIRAPQLIIHILNDHKIHDLSIQEIEIEEVIRRVYRESEQGKA